MSNVALLVRKHSERYDTGDYADAADHAILIAASEILARDTDTAPPSRLYAHLARSFAIFDAYPADDAQGIAVGVDPKLLYAGPRPSAVSDEHRAELAGYGWAPYGDTCFHTQL